MKNKSLINLFWPIFFETLFLMLAGSVDTLMLSSLNDNAVGAVGTANTYLSLFIIMFSIISTGMVAVMTQYIGAGLPYIAKRAKNLGIVLNGSLGIILSLTLGVLSKEILITIGVAKSILEYATVYMTIVGGASIITALIPIYSNYLRSFGYTKITMYANIIANICNLLLNSIFLFVFKMGVTGIAIATVISKIVNLIILMFFSNKKIYFENDELINSAKQIPTSQIFKQILRIGLPAATETALYNLSMALIIRFLNQMDSEGINITARSFVVTITNLSFCAGLALAQANAITIGWNIGQHKFEKSYKDTFKALKYGLIICISISILFVIFSNPILSLFIDNSKIKALAYKLLIIDIFLEIGRIMNLVFANALKTAGDAFYIVVVASIVMLIIGVGGTYFLGIHLKYMAVGAYIAMALDELIRGIISILRWISKKWQEKALI